MCTTKCRTVLLGTSAAVLLIGIVNVALLPVSAYGQAEARQEIPQVRTELQEVASLIRESRFQEAYRQLDQLDQDGTLDDLNRMVCMRLRIRAYGSEHRFEDILNGIQETRTLKTPRDEGIVIAEAVRSLRTGGAAEKALSVVDYGWSRVGGNAEGAAIILPEVQSVLIETGTPNRAHEVSLAVAKEFSGDTRVARAAIAGLGDHYISQSLWDKAYDVYREVEEFTPEVFDVGCGSKTQYGINAAHHSDAGVRLRAITLLEEVLDQWPNSSRNVFVYHTLGRVYYGFGEYTKAEFYLQACIRSTEGIDNQAWSSLATDAEGLIRLIHGKGPVKLSDEADLQDRAQAGLEAVVDDSIQKTGQVAESGRVADPVETSHGTRNEVEGDSPKGASFVSGGGRSAVWRLSLLGGAGILICGVSGFLLIRQCYHKEEPVI